MNTRGYAPERETRPTIKEVADAAWGGIWALLFPVVLLLGLRFGVFTPSEIGAFAVSTPSLSAFSPIAC